MISERKFSEKFTSFWNDTMPRGAAVSRFINLQVQRFAKPIRSEIPGRRRALVNELGFRLFIQRIQSGKIMEILDLSRVTEIGREVEQFLSRKSLLDNSDEILAPRAEEIEEATILAHRLARFFLIYENKSLIVPEPYFSGCGILDSCRGDVFAGSTLYEVKSSEEGFRVVDIRQVLTYCTLNHARPLHPISSVGFVNPRLGVFFVTKIDILARSAAGISADSLFFDTANFLVSQSASQ